MCLRGVPMKKKKGYFGLKQAQLVIILFVICIVWLFSGFSAEWKLSELILCGIWAEVVMLG